MQQFLVVTGTSPAALIRRDEVSVRKGAMRVTRWDQHRYAQVTLGSTIDPHT